MSSFSPFSLGTFVALASAAMLAACTVEPLARAQSDTAIASGGNSNRVSVELAAIEVLPMGDRVGQRVRNAVLFSLNGGVSPIDTRYRLQLSVASSVRVLAVRSTNRAPTAAQVVLTTVFTLRALADNAIVSSGQQVTVANFDRGTQSFATGRAQRDAEDRAAADAAEQLRLALSRDLAAR